MADEIMRRAPGRTQPCRLSDWVELLKLAPIEELIADLDFLFVEHAIAATNYHRAKDQDKAQLAEEAEAYKLGFAATLAELRRRVEPIVTLENARDDDPEAAPTPEDLKAAVTELARRAHAWAQRREGGTSEPSRYPIHEERVYGADPERDNRRRIQEPSDAEVKRLAEYLVKHKAELLRDATKEQCGSVRDTGSELGTIACTLPAGHEGDHSDGIAFWG